MVNYLKYGVLLCFGLVAHGVYGAIDRRCKFHDLSKVQKELRKPQSPIIQFYSSSDNIGNFLPILGIQEMLGISTDVWCMHDKDIDFDFINTHYKGAIIGGAGLLNSCFEPFWIKLRDNCTLPMIMWGLGICLPYKHGEFAAGVSKEIVQAVAKKCDLVNLRDLLTAQYYQLSYADISLCPTVIYLQKFKRNMNAEGLILYDSHSVSLGKEQTEKIISMLSQHIKELKVINNIQAKNFGLEDYINEYYCKSSLVITSRLHGAIIAYGLGIPCIMIPGDYKLNSFQETYGFGTCVSSAKECLDIIATGNVPFGTPLDLDPVRAFGQKACAWMARIQQKVR
ncbi:MAG: polysaccharide pyruvyl transferase family protein [Candidatus Babeliales bacterium]